MHTTECKFKNRQRMNPRSCGSFWLSRCCSKCTANWNVLYNRTGLFLYRAKLQKIIRKWLTFLIGESRPTTATLDGLPDCCLFVLLSESTPYNVMLSALVPDKSPRLSKEAIRSAVVLLLMTNLLQCRWITRLLACLLKWLLARALLIRKLSFFRCSSLKHVKCYS